jgi:hypothetical protein
MHSYVCNGLLRAWRSNRWLAVAVALPIAALLSGYSQSAPQVAPDPNLAMNEYATVQLEGNAPRVGKIVLICWHHSHLADLASSLGVLNVPHWSGTVFDRLWEISFASSPPALADKPQSLLYGDSKT